MLLDRRFPRKLPTWNRCLSRCIQAVRVPRARHDFEERTIEWQGGPSSQVYFFLTMATGKVSATTFWPST
jgi:hypothetical protein